MIFINFIANNYVYLVIIMLKFIYFMARHL